MRADRRLSDAELGDHLDLSEVTVKSHVCSLLPKPRSATGWPRGSQLPQDPILRSWP
jgi:hypothetical protein